MLVCVCFRCVAAEKEPFPIRSGPHRVFCRIGEVYAAFLSHVLLLSGTDFESVGGQISSAILV